GEAAGLQHAALHRLGEPPQVHVAVDELAPAVADADHGPSAKGLVGHAGRLQPRPMEEAVEVLALEPLRAPEPLAAVSEARTVPHRGHVAPRSGSREQPYHMIFADGRQPPRRGVSWRSRPA